MDPRSPNAPDFRHVFQDRFIPQLYRLFMSSLDGQMAWRDLVNRLDEQSQEDYIRLNISLPLTNISAIDNPNQMPDLRQSVHLQSQSQGNNLKIAFTLLSSEFYFELSAPPQFISGLYLCRGLIRCRGAGAAMANALERVHKGKLGFSTETEKLGALNMEQDICHLCHRFYKKVEFCVRDLADPVVIYLYSDQSHRRRISAFPQTMNWFVQQQGFTAVFGRQDHGIPGKFSCQVCDLGFKSLKRSMIAEAIPSTKRRKM